MPEFLSSGDNVQVSVEVNLKDNASVGLKNLATQAQATAGEVRKVVEQLKQVGGGTTQQGTAKVLPGGRDPLRTVEQSAMPAVPYGMTGRFGSQAMNPAAFPVLRIERIPPLAVEKVPPIKVIVQMPFGQGSPDAGSPGLWSRISSGARRLVGMAEGGTVPNAPYHVQNYAKIGSDSVPAMLTPKEHVINAESAEANRALLHRINAARGPVHLAGGGDVLDPESMESLKHEKVEETLARSTRVLKQVADYNALHAKTPEGKALRLATKKQFRGDIRGLVSEVFGQTGKHDDDDITLDAHGRNIKFAMDPLGKSVHLDFTQEATADPSAKQHSGSQFGVTAQNLQTGSVDLLHKFRQFVQGAHKLGAGIEYETEEPRRERLYAKVMTASGYKQEGEGLWKPLKLAGGGAVPDHVAAAVKQHGGEFNLAPLHHIRSYLAERGIDDRTAQDAAIMQARRSGTVSGSGLEGRHGIDPAHLAASIQEDASKIGYLSLKMAGGGIVGHVKEQLLRLRAAMETRYGKAGAAAILASGQAVGWGTTAATAAMGMPLMVPGMSLVGALPGVAVAEAVRYLRRPRHLAGGGMMPDQRWEPKYLSEGGAAPDWSAATHRTDTADIAANEQLRKAIAARNRAEMRLGKIGVEDPKRHAIKALIGKHQGVVDAVSRYVSLPASSPLPAALDERATLYQKYADQTATGGFGENKVLINHAYQTALAAHPGLTLEQFKKDLAVLQQSGKVKLSRADLVQAMNVEDVNASEVQHPAAENAVFHFIQATKREREQTRPQQLASGGPVQDSQHWPKYLAGGGQQAGILGPLGAYGKGPPAPSPLDDRPLNERLGGYGKETGPYLQPRHLARGGGMWEPRGTDTQPAMLTPGEFVVNRASAEANRGLLDRVNAARGPVKYLQHGTPPSTSLATSPVPVIIVGPRPLLVSGVGGGGGGGVGTGDKDTETAWLARNLGFRHPDRGQADTLLMSQTFNPKTMMGKVGGAAQVLTQGNEAVATVIGGVAKEMTMWRDASIPQMDKVRETVKKLPLGFGVLAESIIDLTHAVRNAQEKARLAAVEIEKAELGMTGASEIRMQLAPIRQQGAAAAASHAAFGQFPGTPGPAPNLATTPWLYQHWERLVPLERNQAMAERESRGAEAAQGVAAAQRDKARVKQADLARQVEVGQKEIKEFAATGSEAQRYDLATKVREQAAAMKMLEQATKEVATAEQAYTTIAKTAADARSAKRKGEVGVLQEQLNLAKENTKIAEASTVGIGMMQFGSTRAYARQAMEQVEKFGIGALTPDQIGLIQRADPSGRFLRKFALEGAEADPETQRIRDILGRAGVEPGESYKETAKREIDLNHQIQEKIDIDIKLSAEDLKNILSPEVIQQMDDQLKAMVKARIGEKDIADIIKNILGAAAKR